MSEAAEQTEVAQTDRPSAARKGVRDWDKASATFRADYLHALEPIIRLGQGRIETWSVSGLIIEPVASGGALLVATNGSILAALHDQKATATRPMRLTIPDVLFERAAPARGPTMWEEGETFEVDPPEWMQPGIVWAWGLAAYVLPKMHIPGEDPENSPALGRVEIEEGNVYAGGYRLHPEPPKFDWRKLFHLEREAAAERLNVYPRSIAVFERIERLFGEGCQLGIGGQNQAILLSIPGRPEFAGAMMPNRIAPDFSPLPAWLSA